MLFLRVTSHSGWPAHGYPALEHVTQDGTPELSSAKMDKVSWQRDVYFLKDHQHLSNAYSKSVNQRINFVFNDTVMTTVYK